MGNRIRIGGGARKIRISLRIFGDDLDPDEISRRLECSPTDAYRKGAPILDERYAKTGTWLLLMDDAEALEAGINALLAKLTPDFAVWHELASKYRMDIFCGVFFGEENSANGGFGLSPALMQSLAERGLEIGFDVYFD